MPANTTSARDFLLTTDYPLDMVVYLKSGSATVPFPTAGFTVTIPHGLPFVPLVGGSWDVTSTFETNYNYNTGTIPSSNPTASPFNVSVDITADATNIYLSPINVSGSAVDIYYRIFALEPADSQADLPSTASSGDDFVLNTDYNYTKLFTQQTITSTTGGTTYTITHNLGYRPQIMVWYKDSISGMTQPLNITNINSGDPLTMAAKVTETTVDLIFGFFSSISRVDIRVYIDESGPR